MRLALIVEYDGTDFNGSQFQSNARTVQGVLEDAAWTIFGEQVGRIQMASRTDSGVHALGQVASFDLETRMLEDELRSAMNGNLPADVAVKRICVVPGNFDPRRSAIAREYRYVINDKLTYSPLRRHYEYHVRRRLDDGAMADAARHFVGVHDFASFAAASSDEGSTVRRVERATFNRMGDGRLVFDIRANAFVRQQIRRMVAALILVGEGSRSAEWIESLVFSPRQNSATRNAPPHGLTLMRVVFDPELGLETTEAESG